PLLLAAGNAPRVLVPRGPTRSCDAARSYLAAVQTALPALLAAARRTEELHRLAITDHLTGAYNRRYFYGRTEQVLQRAEREGTHATLLLYDIDDFKRYNDTYGHAAGDEILRDTAALMKRITRSRDVVARIGGDEFAVLFVGGDEPRSPNSQPPENAYALADRFRRAVQAHAFTSLGPEATGTLTISGGLAGFPRDGRYVRELLRKADIALRAAKASGKNAIHLVGREE
ncbi:MAG: GGDEF domain-containing protein, partial [Phycisphaerae bacterium]